MCRIHRRIGAVFCTFGIILMFIAGLMFNTYAEEVKNAKLTLVCMHDNVSLSNMNWLIYKVGEKRGNSYVLTDEFADYPVDLSEIMESTESMTEAASTLSNFAVLDGIMPHHMNRTKSNGEATFYNLEQGLYLAVGNKLKVDSVSYFPTPFLFEMNGADITAYPKFIAKYTLPGSMDRFSLRKIWANAALVNQIPPSLTIEIYQDGKLFDTVEITAEDNWTYSWDGDASSEWRVKEKTVPAGCFVMYRNNEIQFVIMNSYDNDLLARVTTTTALTTTILNTNTTTVSLNGENTSATTKNPFIDINSNTTSAPVTTTPHSVQPGSSTVNSGGTATTTKNPLIDIGTGTAVTTVSATTQIVQSGSSAVSSNTATTVIGEGTTETYSTETHLTDINGSTIAATSTSKENSGSKPTVSSRKTTVITSAEKLPQTGQLWWPVPVMLIGGFIFVAIGLRLLLDSRKED